VPAPTGSDDRADLDIDRGEGDTPAVNFPGPKADDDRAITPGNRGWDEPAAEQAETLDGAVRRAGRDQNGEPAARPTETPDN
jgi:hypothetical protein